MVGRNIFCVSVLSILTAAAFADEPVQRCPCCGQSLPLGLIVTNTVVSAPAAEAVSAEATALVSVASVTPEQTVPRDWKLSVYGGFSAKSGNTTSSSYNYGGEYEKKNGKLYRYKLAGDGRYSKTENQVNTSKAELAGEMRRLMGERWFSSGRLSAVHDDIKELSYRVKAGPGAGLYLVDSKTLTADVGTGPVYVQEKSSGEVSDYIAWRLSQRVDWQVTEILKCWAQTEFFLNTMDTAHYQISFKSGMESKLNSYLSLIVSVENDYDSLPERSGQVSKNDLEFNTGLRYHF